MAFVVKRARGFLPFKHHCGRTIPIGEATGSSVTTVDQTDIHVGTGFYEPTSDAGYTTTGFTPTATTIDQPLPFREKSIYAGLGVSVGRGKVTHDFIHSWLERSDC